MSNAATPGDVQSKKIRDWLLAILRYAVTLDDADRASVFIIAREMDRAGPRTDHAMFTFFLRTSTELCDAIADKDSGRKTSLRHHLKRIDDARLRRALEAATRSASDSPPVKRDANLRTCGRKDLWKGLPQSDG